MPKPRGANPNNQLVSRQQMLGFVPQRQPTMNTFTASWGALSLYFVYNFCLCIANTHNNPYYDIIPPFRQQTKSSGTQVKLYLAPMEGVIDHHMRNILTRIGGYQHCVTEFVRVTDKRLPASVFRRICPELEQACKTNAETPVTIQLLGGEAEAMAENAQRAIELGAKSIDINFGCPSRFVNRKEGGAVLLKEPERLFRITDAVRRAVPGEIPVSAKIRLGYDSTDLALENARAVETANASFITVHARTKVDGYTHPARWEWLGKINESLKIPMVANGDINSVDDFLRCREISNCQDFMLGRGAIALPDLARQIAASQSQDTQSQNIIVPMPWNEVKSLILELALAMQLQTQPSVEGPKILGRLKQWLVFLKKQYPQAAELFIEIRQLKQLSPALDLLQLNEN